MVESGSNVPGESLMLDGIRLRYRPQARYRGRGGRRWPGLGREIAGLAGLLTWVVVWIHALGALA